MRPVIMAVAPFIFTLAVVGNIDHSRKLPDKQTPDQQRDFKITLNDAREIYKVGDDIRLKVTIENQTDERARVVVIDPYYQNRPKLLRNGTLADYQAKVDRLIRSKDRSPDVVRLTFVSIEPQSSKDLPWLDLKEWYGVLTAGSYRLTNKYRIRFDGPWTNESAEIQFRVVKEDHELKIKEEKR